MTTPSALVGDYPPVASQSDTESPLRHIKVHHANDDHPTQCVLILAPMGGTVKALPASAYRLSSDAGRQ
jgi:hypothetical protein